MLLQDMNGDSSNPAFRSRMRPTRARLDNGGGGGAWRMLQSFSDRFVAHSTPLEFSMNKLVRLISAFAATGALFLAPAAMAKTHHHHHAKTHHVVHHKMAVHRKMAAHHTMATHRKMPMHHKMMTRSHKLTAQQEKMAQCAHQSKGMKGAAHRAFMSKCLKK